jgi:coenzyme PQQ synthesis protein D (PqqD)
VNSPGTIISRHAETVAVEIDGEVMLMSLQSGRTFGLDKRGTRIWELLEQPQTLAALVDALVKQYDTTPEQCQADVLEFLGRMVASDLAILQDTSVPDSISSA